MFANKFNIAKVTFALLWFVAAPSLAFNIEDVVPHLKPGNGVPMTMVNLSRDHQLSYKAYNEYSDLNGDGVPETTYLHSYDYYGYFDSHRCYEYDPSTNIFKPNGAETPTKYCSGYWSGNFLNWATMTRMDVVRKILYGGLRSTDTTNQTILERAYLPTDAHSFAKYYNGSDIGQLTPFSVSEITLCNTTITSSTSNSNRYSHTNTDPPLIRVASGNYSLWNANERWQCYWSEEKNAVNGNTLAKTGLNASGSNPSRSATALGSGIRQGDFVVRVQVCSDPDSSMTQDELGRCRKYPQGSRKPIGLLHIYGENGQSQFGMITGSYSKNISGGVLRRNIASFGSEVNYTTDGTYTSTQGIVFNLNKLRQYGYDYSDGTYIGADNCTYQRVGIGTGGSYAVNEGSCSSWGNPIGTMFLESLRYFAGASSATSAFALGGSSKDAAMGLTVEAFSDPFNQPNSSSYGAAECRPINVINFNASVNSYDSDSSKWNGFSSLNGSPNIDTYTDLIGSMEGLYGSGTKWFVGNNGTTDNNNLCTAKSISSLAAVKGICPEAPTYYGSFKLAGAAYYAHTSPIRTDFPISAGNNTAFRVNSYGVALATGSPKIEINVGGKKVVVQPSYRLDLGGSNVGAGTLVDFRIVTQTPTYGKYVVQWEDSEQGGDYDQDVWGTMEYQVNGSEVTITTNVAGFASANGQGMGYVISGTNRDGPHYHSGAYNFTYTDPNPVASNKMSGTRINSSGGCNGCNGTEGPSSLTFTATGFSGDTIKDPLFYAAKYGNFTLPAAPATYTVGTPLTQSQWDVSKTDGTSGSDGLPDAYFYAINPAELERSMRSIFANTIPSGGTAPSITGSRLQVNSKLFLTKYSSAKSTYATGDLSSFGIDSQGNQAANPDWSAASLLTARTPSSRQIITNVGGVGQPFQWSSLSAAQKLLLNWNTVSSSVDTNGSLRLSYLRGDRTNEATSLFRTRNSLLGDIINSNPWYVGAPSAAYPDQLYPNYQAFLAAYKNRTPIVYVGANDGMLHGFEAGTGNEVLAFVPNSVYKNLSKLPDPNYHMRTFVDGALFVADALDASGWKTVLVGSTGRGAQSIFALDVTNPAAFAESNATSIFKWEFSDRDDADLGNVIGAPTSYAQSNQTRQIVKLNNNKWAFIIGNGYGSDNSADFSGVPDSNVGNGGATLFVLFLDGPTGANNSWIPTTSTTGDYVKIRLYDPGCGLSIALTDDRCKGAGPNNGLGVPTPVDVDNDGVVDYIYAADIKGNVWKIDVTGAPTNWSSSYSRLYSATTTSPIPPYNTVQQPITTAVSVLPHPFGGLMVNFVTGKSLVTADLADATQQTAYGIWDRPLPLPPSWPPSGLSRLQQQGVGTTTTTVNVSGGGTTTIRKGTSVDVDWNNKDGWYYNLPFSGEKGVSNPYLNGGDKLIFDTLFVSSASANCGSDPSTVLNMLDPITGKVPKTTFDSNRNGVIDAADRAPSGIVIDGGISGSTRVSGITQGGPNPPPSCGQDALKVNTKSGKTSGAGADNCTNTGRIYWREILRNR